MEKRLIIALLVAILLIRFVTASFEVSEYKDMQKKYSAVRGTRAFRSWRNA